MIRITSKDILKQPLLLFGTIQQEAGVVKWYTRYLEVVVPERVCRFNSCSRHTNFHAEVVEW